MAGWARRLPESERALLSMPRRQLVQLILNDGYDHRDEPFQLSSGEWSHDYIDGKRAIAAGAGLRIAATAVLSVASENEAEFDAVGGLTMGSDPLAHAIALLADKKWFSVRKQAKSHGKQKLIEGAELSSADQVLLVDDVVTTGRSIAQALDAIEEVGASVVLAVALVDRGDSASGHLAARGIRYEPVATYRDLRIDPVGRRTFSAAPSS